MTQTDTKQILEALLFATHEPLPIKKMQEIVSASFPITAKEIRQALDELQEEYQIQNRAFRLQEIAEGYALRTEASFYPYLQLLFASRKKERLSQAAMETLAIIAYKQPVTKAQIEAIRGVDAGGVLQHIQERGLVEVTGKLDVPGRPSLFGTTKEFLKLFGLNSLADLPPIAQEKNL